MNEMNEYNMELDQCTAQRRQDLCTFSTKKCIARLLFSSDVAPISRPEKDTDDENGVLKAAIAPAGWEGRDRFLPSSFCHERAR